VSRIASRDRFAACNGTAPIEVSSGNRIIYRRSLRGNRRLNHAIHMAAITQIRYEHSVGRAYYDKKIAEGKTPKEALRALKRQISDAIYTHLKADAARAAAAGAQGPGGQRGNDSVASAAGSHPERQLFGQATPGPVTTLRRPADQQKRASSHAREKTVRTTDTKRHRSVLEQFLRHDPFDARRTAFSVASAIFWRIRGELQQPELSRRVTIDMRAVCGTASSANVTIEPCEGWMTTVVGSPERDGGDGRPCSTRR
jgi:hypothetical protein